MTFYLETQRGNRHLECHAQYAIIVVVAMGALSRLYSAEALCNVEKSDAQTIVSASGHRYAYNSFYMLLLDVIDVFVGFMLARISVLYVNTIRGLT